MEFLTARLLTNSLLNMYGDHFLLLADYVSYIASQERVDTLYHDREEWSRPAILKCGRHGALFERPCYS